jgi:hypothetical protein
MDEITKALHSIEFACGDLQQAYAKAKPVLAFALLDIVEQANALNQRLQQLVQAISAES